MEHIEAKLEDLKKDILAMAHIVKIQLQKTKQAVTEHDVDLAEEVLANEKRLNAMEQKIEKACENILALYTPVAIDLRFVLASLKINQNLERIGDHTQGIAQLIGSMSKKLNNTYFNEFNLDEMFETAISMMENIFDALENNDTKIARKVFKKDEYLNKKYKKATKIAIHLIESDPKDTKFILPLLTAVRKVERIGDLTKSMGKEIIFHLEAEEYKPKK